MIDSIVAASATPYSALHDIDANKPSGSIRIRVRTYAHALQRHVEKLEDLRVAKDELARRIDARRRELRALRRGERVAGNDPLDEAYAAYLGEEKPIRFAPIEPRTERACASTVKVHPITIHRRRPAEAPDATEQRRLA
jgi:hypothetical protein